MISLILSSYSSWEGLCLCLELHILTIFKVVIVVLMVSQHVFVAGVKSE